MIYHEIVEHDGIEDKRSAYRLDPMPYKWTLYKHGEILTYGYCHSQGQAEEMVVKEMQARS